MFLKHPWGTWTKIVENSHYPWRRKQALVTLKESNQCLFKLPHRLCLNICCWKQGRHWSQCKYWTAGCICHLLRRWECSADKRTAAPEIISMEYCSLSQIGSCHCLLWHILNIFHEHRMGQCVKTIFYVDAECRYNLLCWCGMRRWCAQSLIWTLSPCSNFLYREGHSFSMSIDSFLGNQKQSTTRFHTWSISL